MLEFVKKNYMWLIILLCMVLGTILGLLFIVPSMHIGSSPDIYTCTLRK